MRNKIKGCHHLRARHCGDTRACLLLRPGGIGRCRPDIRNRGRRNYARRARVAGRNPRRPARRGLWGAIFFRIATRSDEYSICDHLGDLYAEQLTGDVISDAVFNRNRKVEERFNFKIKPIVIDSKKTANPTNLFKRSVLAGDDGTT